MVELTTRQQEVYDLLAEGKTYTQIGAELGLTYRTVEFYAGRIAEKLPGTGAPLRKIVAHAVQNAVQNGHI
jgi:DNA-binding NarL/FixJ family response regulator